MASVDNTLSLLANTEILKYKGIYALGSDQEKFIYKLRELSIQFWSQADELSIRLEFGGDIISSGILPKLVNSGLWEAAVPPEGWDKVAILRVFDGPDLVKFDARIRWCRMILNQTEPEFGLERLRKLMAAQRPRTPFWYAAKCLMHSTRTFTIVNSIPTDEPISDFSLFGLFRELIAFGETWAEAKFIINHGDAAISGSKYRKKSKEGAALRLGKFADHTLAVLSEMKRLIEANHSQSSAARIAAAKGLGKSANANRALWQRHTKNL